MTRTLYLAAIATLTGALLATLVSAASAATDGIDTPTTDHVSRVEGAWRVGFRTYNDDGTSWILHPVPVMLQRQCGRGSDTARTCRVAWRGFYNELRAIRDADPNGPDYWPFPGPPA